MVLMRYLRRGFRREVTIGHGRFQQIRMRRLESSFLVKQDNNLA